MAFSATNQVVIDGVFDMVVYVRQDRISQVTAVPDVGPGFPVSTKYNTLKIYC